MGFPIAASPERRMSSFQRRTRQMRRAIRQETLREGQIDAVAASRLPGLRTFFPWTEWSMRPSSIVAILNQFYLRGHETVLECGGGLSTLMMGMVAKQRGRGRIVSLEEDAGWAAIVETAASDNDLNRWVQVIHAPLEEDPFACGTGRWYAKEVVDGLLPMPIDLLVVDGPSTAGSEEPRRRYPALPVFKSCLTKTAVIALDDCQRDGERAVVEAWEKEYGIRFSSPTYASTVAIGNQAG